MAEKITGFKFGSTQSTGYKYDWSEWLNGEVWKLVRGTDFETHPTALRTAIYNAAKSRGLKAKTSVLDENTIVVQALKASK